MKRYFKMYNTTGNTHAINVFKNLEVYLEFSFASSLHIHSRRNMLHVSPKFAQSFYNGI